MTSHITVVGSINADLSVRVNRHPKPGETIFGTGGSISPGGKGANQAVAAALQGAKVAFVGAVGNDTYATPATALMVAAGVDMEGVGTRDETTGLAVITVDADGENSIVVVPGANADVTAAYVDAHAETVRTADIVLLQGEIPADGFEAAVKHATGRVVVNLAPVIPVPQAALLQADPLLANEHEAGLILELLGHPAEGEPEVMSAALVDAGFASVVLTLGGRGAIVATHDDVTHIPAAHVTPADTTGAGDAFAGALVARLLAGETLIDAASHAARVAAYAVTGAGAQPSYPDLNDSLPEI